MRLQRYVLAFKSTPAAELVQELLEVVAVEVGPAKDEALLHVVLVDEPLQHARLEALDRLGPRLAGGRVGPGGVIVLVRVVRVRARGGLEPRAVLPRVHHHADVVHRLGHEVTPLEVHPHGILAQHVRELLDLGRVQRR